MFTGRQQELQTLHFLLKKKSASLVVIRGRRRIGKSQLAKQFGKASQFLAFSGLPPTDQTTAQAQKIEFSKQLALNCHAPQLIAEDWSDLFAFLIRETNKKRVIILLDEISWMGDKDPLFLGKLKNAWEQLKENPKLILILCGSVSSWIESNILSSTGFMGRISLDLSLDPLPLKDCKQLLTHLGLKGNARELFKILAITGGVPRYLEEIQGQLSADDNIRRLCFNKSGILFREFEDIFHDLFSTKSQFYKKIAELLAHGDKTFNDICAQLGVSKSGTWSQYLDELVKAGFVCRDFTWALKTGKTSSLSRFRLSDNYLRFYLKYIEPHKDNIRSGLFANKSLSSLPGWESIMALQFENLVLNNRASLWHACHITAEDIVAHGPYFQRKTNRHAGCQIDYLIKTRFNTLIVCEIKFSKNPITIDIINAMQQKIRAITVPRGYAVWPVLVHVNGVSESLSEQHYFTHIIDFSDLV